MVAVMKYQILWDWFSKEHVLVVGTKKALKTKIGWPFV
ncbi:Hypothetical protein Bdt_3060 [Bdellovibrio bacteriovorus str. Tiberius]|uniref:Uncharacterized protein n=1 Tax=Bdellovibrio bacteriovorus str. Tiberius TaxID=1069642 RepID=K7Z114_BDEBC|nr:Hypothetical protein Bdt_3060 [Bdellovibrio bacteriovorus str. Tiberius]